MTDELEVLKEKLKEDITSRTVLLDDAISRKDTVSEERLLTILLTLQLVINDIELLIETRQ